MRFVRKFLVISFGCRLPIEIEVCFDQRWPRDAILAPATRRSGARVSLRNWTVIAVCRVKFANAVCNRTRFGAGTIVRLKASSDSLPSASLQRRDELFGLAK